MSVNRSKPDQYQLRFPPGLRDRLKLTADQHGRSMNAEIVARLEESFGLAEQLEKLRSYERYDRYKESFAKYFQATMQENDSLRTSQAALQRVLENVASAVSKASVGDTALLDELIAKEKEELFFKAIHSVSTKLSED